MLHWRRPDDVPQDLPLRIVTGVFLDIVQVSLPEAGIEGRKTGQWCAIGVTLYHFRHPAKQSIFMEQDAQLFVCKIRNGDAL